MLAFLIKLDAFCWWVLTLGKSLPGETISAACYRAEVIQGRWLGKVFRILIDAFFRLLGWGPQPHCRNAYYWQLGIYPEGSQKDGQ